MKDDAADGNGGAGRPGWWEVSRCSVCVAVSAPQGKHGTMQPTAVTRFFDGLELAEPGMVQPRQWRPDSLVNSPDQVTAWCGVARKALP